MRDAKKLFDETARPRFSRLPGVSINEILALKLDEVREDPTFDEVLPAEDVMILDENLMCRVESWWCNIGHGLRVVRA